MRVFVITILLVAIAFWLVGEPQKESQGLSRTSKVSGRILRV